MSSACCCWRSRRTWCAALCAAYWQCCLPAWWRSRRTWCADSLVLSSACLLACLPARSAGLLLEVSAGGQRGRLPGVSAACVCPSKAGVAAAAGSKSCCRRVPFMQALVSKATKVGCGVDFTVWLCDGKVSGPACGAAVAVAWARCAAFRPALGYAIDALRCHWLVDGAAASVRPAGCAWLMLPPALGCNASLLPGVDRWLPAVRPAGARHRQQLQCRWAH